MTLRVLVIDNYDSFTYNLVAALREQGAVVDVFRNDAITPADARNAGYTHAVISPGPGKPADAGISIEIVRELGGRIPILGVCLGHQSIVVAYGGTIIGAERLMHGKSSRVQHNGTGIYSGLPALLEAGRYHSLTAHEPLPDTLEVTGRTERGEIMSVAHREHAVTGLQFHPESILTPDGPALLANFLAMRERRERAA